MNNEKVSKILKKYDIYENRSVQEILELLDVKCDSLLERYNRTKNEDIQEEINEIQEVIEYIGKNEAQMSTLLTLMEEAEETAVNHQTDTREAIERLRESSGQASGVTGQMVNYTQQSSAPQGGAAAMQNLTQGFLWFSSNTGNQTVNNLFVQAEDCLKYGEWEKAEHVFDSILAAEPKNPGIFMGKLLAQYKLVKPGELVNKTEYPLETDINLRKAHDFGNPQQAKYIEDLLVEHKKIKIYKEAVVLSAKNTGTDLRKAAVLFDQLADYRDAKMQAELCRNNANKMDNDAREAQRVQSKKDLLKSKLEQFSNIEPGDGIYDLRRLEDLHSEITEIMNEIPETTSKMSEDVLWDMDRKLRDAREYSGFMKKKKFRVNSLVAWILLILALVFGFNWNFNPEWGTVLPVTVFWNRIILDSYQGTTYFSPVPYYNTSLEITNSDIEKVKMPFAKLSSILISETDVSSLDIPSVSYVTIENAPNLNTLLFEGTAQEVSMNSIGNLERLKLPGTVKNLRLSNCMSNELIIEYVGTSDGVLRLTDCTKLEKLVLPEGFFSLEIRNCNKLTELVVPEGVVTLYIQECHSLKNIILPESMQKIDIESCESLEMLDVPKNVTRLEVNGCANLEYVKVYEDISSIAYGWEYNAETENGEKIYRLFGCKVIIAPNATFTKRVINESAEGKKSMLEINGTIKDLSIYGGWNEINFTGSVNKLKLDEFDNLIALSLPETLEELVIEDCASLQEISVPDDVTYYERDGEVIIDKRWQINE